MGKAKRTKRRISNKEFNRKIRIWTLIVPLITSVIGSATMITVAYMSQLTLQKEKGWSFDRNAPQEAVEYELFPGDDSDLEINLESEVLNLDKPLKVFDDSLWLDNIPQSKVLKSPERDVFLLFRETHSAIFLAFNVCLFCGMSLAGRVYLRRRYEVYVDTEAEETRQS